MSEELCGHIHRYYTAANPLPCAWKCACGKWFVCCICTQNECDKKLEAMGKAKLK
jgi:hypothetical protein